jgi:hypothetical protein
MAVERVPVMAVERVQQGHLSLRGTKVSSEIADVGLDLGGEGGGEECGGDAGACGTGGGVTCDV